MSSQDALSVSAALSMAKRQLETITVKVVGEVSELSINARYKAVYFTVKDASASMQCMIWNNRYSACGVDLQIGSLVELTGRFTLYAAKGRMNFDVFSIELAGEGRLRMQVAQLAKRLEAEGLMSPSRKKQLPMLPSRIGLVTSPRGAAVYDVLRTLRRRFPLAEVVFAGVGVEGQRAPQWIIEGLEAVSNANVDVILLVRGGGSYEDLMPFNDESLARYISALDVPVVTGIGHEPDTSIADMVSDFRASTPTSAAEAVAPSMAELAMSADSLQARMNAVMRSRLSEATSKLNRIALMPLFVEPMRLFESDAQQLDDISARLVSAIPTELASSKVNLSLMLHALRSSLSKFLDSYRNDALRMTQALKTSGRTLLNRNKEKLTLDATRLEAYSPLSALTRGYAIAQDESGNIIKSIKAVKFGEPINVQVSDGIIGCVVEKSTDKSYALEDING